MCLHELVFVHLYVCMYVYVLKWSCSFHIAPLSGLYAVQNLFISSVLAQCMGQSDVNWQMIYMVISMCCDINVKPVLTVKYYRVIGFLMVSCN